MKFYGGADILTHIEDSQPFAGRVGSVVKAYRILSLFTQNAASWSLAQISEQLQQPKSTMLNFLRTLESCDLLEKDESTQTYQLGSACLELGYQAKVMLPILPYALPFMGDLQKETGKTVYFTVPKRGRVLYIESVFLGRRNVQDSLCGKLTPMHCNSSGKAMLAAMSDEEVGRIIRIRGLAPVTSATVTDPDVFMKELEETRKRGFAIASGEETIGVKEVAVAIQSPDRILGAISVAGTPLSMPDNELPHIAEKIMDITHQIAVYADLFPKDEGI